MKPVHWKMFRWISSIFFIMIFVLFSIWAYFEWFAPIQINELPSKCTISGGFACTEFAQGRDGILIQINNHRTYEGNATITVECTKGCKGKSIYGPVHLAAGQGTGVVLYPFAKPVSSNAHSETNITVIYPSSNASAEKLRFQGSTRSIVELDFLKSNNTWPHATLQ